MTAVTSAAAVTERGGTAGEPSEDVARPGGLAGRAWALSLGWHLLALALVLLVLATVARPGVATIDEGAYGMQAKLVADGTWSYPEALARFDTDGRNFPISHSTEIDGRWFVHVNHPVVPVTLAFAMRAIGEGPALLLLPLSAAVAAAVAAWLLATEINGSLARPAFWLVASSPLIFNAYVIWTHAPSTALAGGAFVVMVRLLRHGPSPGRLASLAVLLSAGALVRSEGVLVAVAVLAVLAWAFGRAKAWPRLLSLLVPAAAVVASLLAERAWVTAIVGSGAPGDLVVRGDTRGTYLLVGRFEGVWKALLRGGSRDPFEPAQLVLPVACAVAVLVVLLAGRRRTPWVEAAVVGLVAVHVLFWVAFPTTMVTGLVPAAPLLVLGAVLALGDHRDPSTRAVLAATALLGGGIVATQYSDGGGFSWGGRFFAPALVPLAVLAAAGLHRLVVARPPGRRRSTVGALAAVGIVVALVPVAVLGETRAQIEPIYRQVADNASAVNVSSSEHLPRLMWRQDLDWLYASREQIGEVLASMRRGGIEQVTAVVPADMPAEDLGGWRSVEERGTLGPTGLRVVVLRR